MRATIIVLTCLTFSCSAIAGKKKTLPSPPTKSTPKKKQWYPMGTALAFDDWLYPVRLEQLEIPRSPKSREMFGAKRLGPRPPECLGGHCGIDIVQPYGSPVIAVADGIVQRAIFKSRHKTGRYVEILHVNGVVTQYMHLGSITRGIKLGATVAAGQILGTLGKSGVAHSAPHLHFAAAREADEDICRLTFFNPLPALQTARRVRTWRFYAQ